MALDLSTQDSGSDTGPTQSIPDYLIGADNHNVGNSLGGSWFDPSTWEDKFEGAGKFVAVSMLSGADSLYNSAATVGNWLGADVQTHDTQAWITSLDQDLGQYYSDNRQSADLAGFLATSFLPGMGGVKILNAGQAALRSAKFAGMLGENLSRFTGILAPSTEAYVKLAGQEIASAQSVFNTLNASTLKALGSGLWQNTLEAAAFETAVQATMFKAPTLDKQDGWDIAKNIMVGGVVGGVVGGSFEAARTLSAIKKVRIGEDLALKPFSSREIVQPGTSPADRIILASENRSNTAVPLAPNLPDGASQVDIQLAQSQYANAVAAANKKAGQIDLANRSAMHEMSIGASKDLTNAVADTQVGMGVEDAIRNWHDAIEITAPNATTKLEAAALKANDPSIQSRWINIAGENAGMISPELPPVLSIADRVSGKSAPIADSVMAAVKDAGFTTKALWDPLANASKLSWRDAELRHIWANEAQSIPADISIHQNDIPLLERMLKDNRTDFKVVGADNQVSNATTFGTTRDFKQWLIQRKEDLANDILTKRISKANPETDPIETTTAAIAKTVNVKQSYLEGTRDAVNPDSDLFAWQDLSKKTHDAKVAAGLKQPNAPVTPSYFQPSVAKINYRISDANMNADGHVLDALTFLRTRQSLLHDDAVRVVTKQAGNDIANRMVDITSDDLAKTNSYGAGPGMLKSAQGNYGSIESKAQYLGGVSKDIQIAKRQEVNDAMQPSLYKLANNKAAAIEWDTINQALSGTSEPYVLMSQELRDAGLNLPDETLVAKKIATAYKNADENGNIPPVQLQNGAAEFIPIKNWETHQAIRDSQSLTATRTINAKERYAAQGKVHDYDPDVVRPIRPNPKDYPFFAFVKDPRVSGAGHSSMLFGNTERELQDLVTKTQRDYPEFKVITKKDTQDWFEAHQSYDYNMGLNENYIDSSLKAKGIYSNFYTRSDPQTIANNILQFHYRSADLESAEIMRLRYGDAFDWLENQAQSYAQFETSKFGGGKYETISQNEKNPYLSYIKTSLNLSSTPTSNPWWSLNKFLDNQVSRAVGRIRQTFDAAKGTGDLEATNALMSEYGSNTAFANSAEQALINHTAPKAELSKFVRGANAILGRLTLGLDPINTINTTIGSNVLRGTELTQITKAIANGNTALGGELANLAKVTIPGTDSQILSPSKLIASSIARFFGPEGKNLVEQYRNIGVVRSRLQQFQSMADDLTLRGTESVSQLQSKLSSAFSKVKDLADKGETWSGNKFAEEFNRYLSADVMRQITDLGVKHGVIDSKEALTYINTFVNRVDGSIIASQRPGLFQGPLGQALGLFQSYQFNMLQQMFRYVAEGDKKDLAMLLGLQGTFYGLAGEPGFKFLNDHIVGTASGNKDHRDLYDATRGIAGKQMGEWLLYGAPSNLMQTNMYSRGDMNPRNATLIPTNLADVPFVNGMAQVYKTISSVAQRLSQGGDVWETLRQGIEHNGIYRPLAGLAQTSRAFTNNGTAFSTSTKGSILGSNDLMSLATLSRLAGARPLDEAVMNDTMFSINSYEATDRAKKDILAQAVKTSMIGNKSPDQDEVTRFAEHYNYMGGKQGSFAKYMMEQYTQANTPQAQLLSRKINNPLSYKVQQLMGGQDQF